MRDGLADKRLGIRHLASILGCEAEARQRLYRVTALPGNELWS